MSDPRYTPLRERHEALGASFTDFGGWQMPVRYTSDLAEHHAVRESAGIFDISHMAEFLVTGEAAAEFLDYALAGRISAMPVGKAKYSLLLAEGGGIIDDVIAYRLAEDRYLVIANAGNRGFVDSAFAKRVRDFPSLVERDLPARAPGEERSFAGFLGDRGVDVEDVSDDYALIAVQGPNAEAILAATADITDVSIPWSEQKYYAWASANYRGKPLLLARTGYTGEDGFELLVAADDAAALWDALLAAGTPHGLVPAGLAARDTLRLEAGMPLYGHELSLDTQPSQAGLGRVVVTAKEHFVGKAALSAAAESTEAAQAPVLVGLVAEGKRAGRAGYAVVDEDGSALGEITSGALSPTLGHPIAMAYVKPSSAEEGTAVFLDVRGTRIPATVTALPFYRRTK
ncbi:MULTISPECIES: glycine cleavage system aminomethyltransferase GcvT [Microbacterium]|uniref:Aminomethyltransferase n=3 Tax=Microbacterium TaxID=33882 RepID=A0A4Y4B4X4_MICMQ|nr:MULTISPECIES: glycine cleavage system aminomethyltransferase GcvT [Microbacterium]QYG10478.1 glycine cleavage system protein T [Microbacterium sp. PAMC22086]GEC75635.1 aminomethyltransferase [Microbacterium liquefaciens]GGV56426.1 aminomethyltransferase [Microbacterium liquefaciens]